MGVRRGVRVVRARSPAVSRARALPHCRRPLAGGSRKPPAHRGEPSGRRCLSGTAHKQGHHKAASSPGEGATLPLRTAPHPRPAATCAAFRRSAGRGRPLPGRPWHCHPLRASPRRSAGPAARSLLPPPGTSPVGALPAQSGSPAERASFAHSKGQEGFKNPPKPFPPPSRRRWAAGSAATRCRFLGTRLSVGGER